MVKITIEHMQLLIAAYWRMSKVEYGAPAIDGKRPFGSSSGIESSMAQAIGMLKKNDWETKLTREQEDYVCKLWNELPQMIPEIFKQYLEMSFKCSLCGGEGVYHAHAPDFFPDPKDKCPKCNGTGKS